MPSSESDHFSAEITISEAAADKNTKTLLHRNITKHTLIYSEKYLSLYFIGSLKIFVCSAGVGRTGVFISLSIVLERMQYEGVVDVFQTVSELSLVSWHNTEL